MHSSVELGWLRPLSAMDTHIFAADFAVLLQKMVGHPRTRNSGSGSCSHPEWAAAVRWRRLGLE